MHGIPCLRIRLHKVTRYSVFEESVDLIDTADTIVCYYVSDKSLHVIIC